MIVFYLLSLHPHFELSDKVLCFIGSFQGSPSGKICLKHALTSDKLIFATVIVHNFYTILCPSPQKLVRKTRAYHLHLPRICSAPAPHL